MRIVTRTQSPVVVNLHYDGCLECPSEWDGWKLYSFSRRHNSFRDPESFDLGELKDGLPVVRNPGLRTKLRVGLAFWLSYYEHGNCVWGLLNQVPSCPWDTVPIAGLLVWESKPEDIGAKSYEDRAKDAADFLKTYTAWSNGECYGYTVEDGEGGCGGFYGPDLAYMFDAIREDVGDREVKFVGEAADLADYYWGGKK